MGKQAASPAKKEEAPKKEPKQAKVLKRALILSGVRRYDAGLEVTKEMEDAWVDYYKQRTGKAPIRSIDWYC